ncbi:hypothetical protein QBC34DRAFT_306576 [Podospora aff. communis PSN243]|uniref:Uncharacterized protein n=1 Tax=Podospora aff. communis PSN243 TaxID=3040156 RepID=A0AAV9GC51_9PEZI|nr:hypothetical protein QBC34DRAFT_306576 [Podospora aff. communis PSN243]
MDTETIANASLGESILAPLCQATKAAITSKFWSSSPITDCQRLHSYDADPVDLDKYWIYYAKECSNALHDGGRHAATRTHDDIVECISKLKSGMLREDIKSCLRSKLSSPHVNEDEMLDNSIDLSASLLLMTSFGSYTYGFSGQSSVCWNKGTLRDFLRSYFAPEMKLANENVKLEKIFKASNLVRIAGLEIEWTDNVADHLRMTDDDKRVHIFHHAAFLETQRSGVDSLLPEGLAEETLRTLALLFPAGDLETKRWMAGLPDYSSLDKRLGQCGRLKTDNRRIDSFVFWRDRLVMLKQAFDEAQPKTIRQWWYDSRNGVQWYTFWVAVLVLVLTVVFGLVQSIEGALQVYVSFKALDADGGSLIHGSGS